MAKTLGPWLKLSQAADYLGVHFTTLRRWADEGQVPCIRTPGGRRRFKKEELDAFMASLRQGETAPSPTWQNLDSQVALVRAGHSGLQREPWYGRLDEAHLHTMRGEGRQLMAVLMQYASRSNGGEVFLREGKSLATHYGQVCHAAGLSLVETARAFVLVRRAISDSICQAGALAGPPDADTWRLYDRSNHFLDTMLLTILAAFDKARSG